MDCSESRDVPAVFSKHVHGQLLRINTLLVAHTVLMVVMVGIGAYGHRYRHHRLIRYLFLGVTTLFLPIVSYIISTTSNLQVIAVQLPHRRQETFSMVCDTDQKMLLDVLLWSALVQIVGISTTVIVAGDAREARDIAPSVVLVVEAIWTCYLMAIAVAQIEQEVVVFGWILFPPWTLIFAKLLLKYYSWYKARQSLALRHNPPLIAGYMEQLQADRTQHVELASEHMRPPLIVTGEEDTESVQKQPHGYSFKWISNRGDDRTRRINKKCLVTMDKVWQMCDMLPSTTAHEQLKDVCFSFALFKLLRCRFARYTVADAGFINFLQHVLLEERDDERVLGLIACELTFLHDYYYSSLPISYSKSWLPILSIFISLLSMGYCFWFMVRFTVRDLKLLLGESVPQLDCFKSLCNDLEIHFGNYWFVDVPIYSLIALVLLAEVREIASYICSNWTKIALIRCQASWQQSPTTKKWVGHLLQRRCKMLKHWEDKMNLCSIIEARRSTPLLARLRRLISLPDQKKKVPTAVKVALVQAMRSHVRAAGNMITSSKLQLQVGDNPPWTFNGAKGTADMMLVCHVATSILEVRSEQPQLVPSDHKIAATHLSRYCAYLVAYCPELLPDYDLWCKSLYKAVKKEAERIGVVAPEAATPQVKYQLLLEQLTTRSEHEVLKNGAELGRELVELTQHQQGEDKAWELLAGFWSEMILHVAPSDNLDGHAQAIARGGELITLLWALLGHLGKPDYTAPDAAC